MTEPNIEEILVKRLAELETGLKQAKTQEQFNDIQRQLNELRLQVEQGLKRFVDSKDLEGTLKEVNGHVVLPKGKYHVNFDIVVNPHGTLEIQPGVELYFGWQGGIVAYGSLRAMGNQTQKIIFTSSGVSHLNITIYGKFSSDSIIEYSAISNGAGRTGVNGMDTLAEYHYEVGPRWRQNRVITGGGIMLIHTDAIIRNCVVQDNKAMYGAGMFIDSGKPVIENNQILKNTLISQYYEDELLGLIGGGILITNSSAIIRNNRIQNHYAQSGGGGIEVIYSDCEIVGNHFIDNGSQGDKREGYGGAINIVSHGHLLPTMSGNHFQGNNPWDISIDRKKKGFF